MNSNAVSDSAEILAIAKNLIGKVPNVMDAAHNAISRGESVGNFRAWALGNLPSVSPVQNYSLAEVHSKDWSRYSISRAIANGGRDGFEREMSDEITRQTGKSPTGFFIPNEAFATRSLVAGTGTLGGFAVQTTNEGSEFIQALRNKSQVLNLGARVLQLSNPTTIPRQNGAGTVNWVGETVASTLTAVNFQQLTLTPYAVSAQHQYSKQLLVTSSPSIDSIVRDDILATIALEIDRVALHGTGSGQPTGIANTSGIGTVQLATNGLSLANSTAYPALVSLETTVAAANADMGNLGYLMRSGHRAALKTQQRFSNTDSPVFTQVKNPDGSVEGLVNGYRCLTTQNIATNLTAGTASGICSTIFFANWNDLILAEFGALDLVTDNYTLGANGVVKLYARKWVDVGLRRPASACLLTGVLTT